MPATIYCCVRCPSIVAIVAIIFNTGPIILPIHTTEIPNSVHQHMVIATHGRQLGRASNSRLLLHPINTYTSDVQKWRISMAVVADRDTFNSLL